MPTHLLTSTPFWPSELLAPLQPLEWPGDMRISRYGTTLRTCRLGQYPHDMHNSPPPPHSTLIQHKIYTEDFEQITDNLPFLKKRLESDDPSRVIRKITHRVCLHHAGITSLGDDAYANSGPIGCRPGQTVGHKGRQTQHRSAHPTKVFTAQ